MASPVYTFAGIHYRIHPHCLTSLLIPDGASSRTQTGGLIVYVDSFPAGALGQGKYFVHNADMFVDFGRVVPPLPGILVDWRHRKAMYVFDRPPVTDRSVLVARSSFSGAYP